MGIYNLAGLRLKKKNEIDIELSDTASKVATQTHHILFVCTGNIARSAAAEILARQLAADNGWTFSSAGVGAVVNHPVAEHIDQELSARNVPIDEHRGQQVTAEMIQKASLVLVMETHHLDWIIREWPEYRSKVHLLKQMARLSKNAGKRSDPVSYMQLSTDVPTRKDNIADPYRKGPLAAHTAVQEIEESLELIIPWLGHPAR